MKLIIMQFPLVPCSLVHRNNQYLPQHCIHEHPQPISTLEVRGQVSHTSKTMGNYISVYCNLYIFIKQMGRQKILDRKVAGIPIDQSALNLVMNILKC